MKKKVVLLGDSAVGKTSLIRRFVFDQFDDAYITTIGSKVSKRELRIERPGRTIDLTLVIWDVLGRAGYQAVHARTFAGVHGALLVADLTREETLASLGRYWIPALHRVVDRIPLVFVANKADLDGGEFSPQDLQALASRHNGGMAEGLQRNLALSYETSAKSGENVERAFETLGHLLLSDATPRDPVRELWENAIAVGIHREADLRTPIGALDAILVDFSQSMADSRMAALILREEVTRAGLDVQDPSKEAILRLVEYLAEAEQEVLGQEKALANRDRRLGWGLRIRSPAGRKGMS